MAQVAGDDGVRPGGQGACGEGGVAAAIEGFMVGDYAIHNKADHAGRYIGPLDGLDVCGEGDAFAACLGIIAACEVGRRGAVEGEFADECARRIRMEDRLKGASGYREVCRSCGSDKIDVAQTIQCDTLNRIFIGAQAASKIGGVDEG